MSRITYFMVESCSTICLTQCDQMARLFVQCSAIYNKKICPIASKNSNLGSNFGPNTKLANTKIAKYLKNLPQ